MGRGGEVRDCCLFASPLEKTPGAGSAPRRPISVAWGCDACLATVLPDRARSKQALETRGGDEGRFTRTSALPGWY